MFIELIAAMNAVGVTVHVVKGANDPWGLLVSVDDWRWEAVHGQVNEFEFEGDTAGDVVAQAADWLARTLAHTAEDNESPRA